MLYKLRVIERADAGGVLRLTCVDEDDPALYTSGAVGGAGGDAQRPTVPLAGQTALQVLDVPLLRDEDDGPGVYVACGSQQEQWPGCVLYRSTDGGATFAELQTVLQRAVMGHCISRPAPWAGGHTVDPSTLDVQIQPGGALETVTWEALMAGANLAVLGDEVIAFRKAELLGGRRWRLSGLLRGLRGTERLVGTQDIGARFVLANTALLRVSSPATLRGRTVVYRAVTISNAVTAGHDVTLTEQHISQQPLAPAHLRVVRPTATTYEISWQGRSRLATPWGAAAAVQSDAPVSYRVTASMGAPAELDQTTTAQAVQFTPFAIVNGYPYTMTVAQVSPAYGRGALATYTT